jgi:hypothetical protein
LQKTKQGTGTTTATAGMNILNNSALGVSAEDAQHWQGSAATAGCVKRVHPATQHVPNICMSVIEKAHTNQDYDAFALAVQQPLLGQQAKCWHLTCDAVPVFVQCQLHLEAMLLPGLTRC